MKLQHISTFMLRLAALQFFFQTVLLTTYFPEHLVAASHSSRLPLISQTAQVSTLWLMFRLGLTLLVGLLLYMRAPQIAKLMTKDLKADV